MNVLRVVSPDGETLHISMTEDQFQAFASLVAQVAAATDTSVFTQPQIDFATAYQTMTSIPPAVLPAAA